MFGVSAVLGATVSEACGVALGSVVHSIFQPSSPPLSADISSQELGLHERPPKWRGPVGRCRFYRLTPAYLTGSCPQSEMATNHLQKRAETRASARLVVFCDGLAALSA
jgi:hypothetical protein